MTRKTVGVSLWLVASLLLAAAAVPALSHLVGSTPAGAAANAFAANSAGHMAPALEPPPMPTDPNLQGALGNLAFRNIGPATMGGRIDDYAVDESNTDVIYVGTAAGGVFKTTNGGTTWNPIFEHEVSASIGAIAIAPSAHDVVYVGTGEANNRQSASYGAGMYKSLDGGRNWTHIGLDGTQAIGRVVVDPHDPNTVYVAALGGLWNANPDRGVYKTTDGGKTWTKSLYISENTGVTDIAMDWNNPWTLYAAAYERRRTEWGFNGGGPEGGIYKTEDGGANWTKLTTGLPYANGGDVGRIGLAVYRRDSNIVYTRIQHAQGGIFRSEDKGATWTKMSDVDSRPMYFGIMAVDPNNDLRVWAPAAALYFSEDGGKTFTTNRGGGVHSDYHGFWIDPHDSNHMMVGVDGGIYMSRDMGRTWEHDSIIAIGQFYEVTANGEMPYKVCGGLQDNGSWCAYEMSLTGPGIINSDWQDVSGGDGFYNRLDPEDPNIDYAESQDGSLSRRNFKTNETRSIRPQPAPGEKPYRFQWNSPIEISVFDHKTVYYGGNFLFRSKDEGDHWDKISPDLTNNVDRRTLKILGVLPTKDELSREDGVEWWPCITVIGESPMNKDVIYVGTDDGNLQVTRDGGKNWANVAGRVPGVPKGTYVTRVIGSKYEEGTAYATFDGHRSGDFHIYMYVTHDYGQNWKPLSNGISEKDGTVHVVREDPKNHDVLYAGTERGLFISLDRGMNWSRSNMNLPTGVPVDDILIHPKYNDMILGTHGRSVWIMDDVSPIQQLNSDVMNSPIHLFDIRNAIEWRTAGGGGGGGFGYGEHNFTGPNPPNGALINFYLKSALAGRDRVTITIADKSGATMRTYNCAPPGAPAPGGAAAGGGGGGRGRGGRGGGGGGAAPTTPPPAPPAPPAGGAPAAMQAEIPAQAAGGGRGGGRGGAGGGAACDGKEGINRVVWDLRYQPPPQPGEGEAGAFGGRGGGGGFGGGGGPRVEPGDYTVKITMGDQTQTKTVHVDEDPRIQITAADRAARYDLMMKAFALQQDLTRTLAPLNNMKTALDNAITSWKTRPPSARIPDNVQKAAEDFQKQVNEVAYKFMNPPEEGQEQGSAAPPLIAYPATLGQRIGQVYGSLQGVTAAPTQDEIAEYAATMKELNDLKPQIDKLVKEGFPALNKLMNDSGVQQIVIVPVAGGGRGRGGEEN
ncbi:MAG TPA: hypothetical protein VGZ48_06225 [Candidatus Acidoferrales bacterium]|jgi:photosystem II stability/assembly factor-like uncharacterized protein|nr:hypothetical protein [Candidatus Acidoferrales bacterium]